MSYLDRPLVHLALIVVFGVLIGILAKPATRNLAARIFTGGLMCVLVGLVVLAAQMNSVAVALEAVTYVTAVRDEFGIGRLVAVGYALMLAGAITFVRSKLQKAPNPALNTDAEHSRRAG